MLLSDLVDIERDPPSEYTALVKFEHFSRLSDDLIGRILYSGYLPRVWNEIVPLLLINKHFMELGKRYISFIDFKSKPWHEAHGGTYSDNVLNAYRIAHNLVHLDLSYTNVNFQLPAIREGFMQWQHSLRGLNLRGTTVEDDFCEIIGHFQHLVYLDVSKVTASQAEWISDEGGAHLVKLKKLRWFCAGSTSITDKTIVLLQKHCKEVNHLVIPACAGLTNEGLACLKSMPLNVLDISNCPLINAEGIKELLSPS